VSVPNPLAVVVSFRLGGTDGVSVEAAKWDYAWRALGFDVRRVAGELDERPQRGDVVLPWLAIDPPAGHTEPRPDELASAVDRAQLVVVENACSLPMNLAASRAVAAVVSRRGGPVVLHHHDLPWQRDQYAGVTDLPPDSRTTLHVVINERSRAGLLDRGIDAQRVVHVPNCFDADTGAAGERDATRHAMGFTHDELVVLQPTRAIPRKNVPGALRFVEELQRRLPQRRIRYWLTGPAEDGYGSALDAVLAGAPVPVKVGRVDRAVDAYAAADLVLFPSTWEGFGNPLAEAAIARRAVVAGPYPVRDELAALGLWFLSLDDPSAAATWLRAPDPARLDANVACVRRHLSVASLPGRLRDALTRLEQPGPHVAVPADA
jgi:glycosyltransferase involved in cell wall biosynthesis